MYFEVLLYYEITVILTQFMQREQAPIILPNPPAMHHTKARQQDLVP